MTALLERLIPIPDLTDKQILRFWSKVDKHNYNECWSWLGPVIRGKNYGIFNINERNYLAHRVSFFLDADIQPILLVLHECDNPICVNPWHLFQGTQEDNMQDKVRKKGNFGGQEPAATEYLANKIRERHKQGDSHNKLVKDFGISMGAIHNILHHKHGY